MSTCHLLCNDKYYQPPQRLSTYNSVLGSLVCNLTVVIGVVRTVFMKVCHLGFFLRPGLVFKNICNLTVGFRVVMTVFMKVCHLGFLPRFLINLTVTVSIWVANVCLNVCNLTIIV